MTPQQQEEYIKMKDYSRLKWIFAVNHPGRDIDDLIMSQQYKILNPLLNLKSYCGLCELFCHVKGVPYSQRQNWHTNCDGCIIDKAGENCFNDNSLYKKYKEIYLFEDNKKWRKKRKKYAQKILDLINSWEIN